MENIYYLGIKKRTAQNNNFFKKKIILTGGGGVVDDDISYQKLYNKEIDYNDMNYAFEIPKFYDYAIEVVKDTDPNALFMLYNQMSYEFMKNKESIICVNDVQLINTLNHKPECRELLKKEIIVVDYKYLKKSEISFLAVSELFDNKFERYVVQQPMGAGGVGTYILDKTDEIVSKLYPRPTYSVSGYVENSIAVNNTFMVSNNYIHIFEGSLQLIKIDNQLKYDGWDFEKYQSLDETTKKNIYEQTLKIAKKLQELGYRGVGGVDYIVKDSIPYFMEINPRFQASTEYIDKKLVQNGLPSIFEINYLAFYDEKKFINTCNRIDEVNNGKRDGIKNCFDDGGNLR